MSESTPEVPPDELAALTAEELVLRFNRAAHLLAWAGTTRPIYEATYGGGVFYLSFPRQAEVRCGRRELEQALRRREALLERWRRALITGEQERTERAYWAARDVITTPEEDDPAYD